MRLVRGRDNFDGTQQIDIFAGGHIGQRTRLNDNRAGRLPVGPDVYAPDAGAAEQCLDLQTGVWAHAKVGVRSGLFARRADIDIAGDDDIVCREDIRHGIGDNPLGSAGFGKGGDIDAMRHIDVVACVDQKIGARPGGAAAEVAGLVRRRADVDGAGDRDGLSGNQICQRCRLNLATDRGQGDRVHHHIATKACLPVGGSRLQVGECLNAIALRRDLNSLRRRRRLCRRSRDRSERRCSPGHLR